jgi:hypothetical protein
MVDNVPAVRPVVAVARLLDRAAPVLDFSLLLTVLVVFLVILLVPSRRPEAVVVVSWVLVAATDEVKREINSAYSVGVDAWAPFIYPWAARAPICTSTWEQLAMPSIEVTSVGSYALYRVLTNRSNRVAEGACILAVARTPLHMLTRAV